uniref:Dna2 domain-containing protein n=1 Tax=Strongyloides stercoralis TaxID=6248 RepID=A0A0K0E3V5_STRER
MTNKSNVLMFKTASNKPIKVDSNILSTAMVKAKRFDEQIETLSNDELFNKKFTTPCRDSEVPIKKAFSEGRRISNTLNSHITPVVSKPLRSYSQSVCMKRRSNDEVYSATPKRFMNSNLSSNLFKVPVKKALPNTSFTTPKSDNTLNNTPNQKCTSTVLIKNAPTGETLLRTINKNLDTENCNFIKIKNICEKESEGKDVVGIVWEVNVTENSEAHMVIIDDTFHGVNAEVTILPTYIVEFKTRLKGRVIVIKDITMVNKKGKNILKISPDKYRFDGDSFDEEDLREWYAFGNISQDKIKIV